MQLFEGFARVEPFEEGIESGTERLSPNSQAILDLRWDLMMNESPHDSVALFERYGKAGDNAALKAFATKQLPHLQQHLLMAQELNR